MLSGSLGIVVGGPDLSGRSNLGEAGRSWASCLPSPLSSPLTERTKVSVSQLSFLLKQEDRAQNMMLIEEGKDEKRDVGRLCSGEVQRSRSIMPFMPCL